MEHKEAWSAQTLESLAEKVMQLNIHTLMIELRYLQVALQQLTLQAEAEGSLSTDGTYCFYRPRTVLQRYKKEPAASVRDYLHMVLHCIFRHMYLSEPVEVNCWDLACDMTVELMINDLRRMVIAWQLSVVVRRVWLVRATWLNWAMRCVFSRLCIRLAACWSMVFPNSVCPRSVSWLAKSTRCAVWALCLKRILLQVAP